MLGRWAFRFLLFYIVVLFTQPQNRFVWMYNLHLADICIAGALILHIPACALEKRAFLRFGPATVLALTLMGAAFCSLYYGPLQVDSTWNSYIDMLTKNALVLILVEAMAFSVQRVWAVFGTIMLATLWWVKAGFRLAAGGATYAGSRIMGPNVSLVENPNGFAYMLCLTIPIYLYFHQQTKNKWARWGYLFLALSGVYMTFNTGSRTGLLALIACGFFILPKYGAKHRVALLAAIIGIGFIVTLIDPGNIERFKSVNVSIRNFLAGTVRPMEELTQDEHSAQERRQKNRDTWRLIKEYPLFGVGINVPDRMVKDKYPFATGEVHNEMLMAGRQMGFPGMGMYFSMLLIMFVCGRKTQKLAGSWWPEAADLGWTFKAQAVVILVGGSFSPIPWNSYNLILVGAASALYGNMLRIPQPDA